MSIVNVTDIEFRPVNRHGLVESTGTGKFVSRLLGSVRVPMDSGKRNLPTERLSACVDYASMSLLASHSADGPLDLIQVMTFFIFLTRQRRSDEVTLKMFYSISPYWPTSIKA